MPLPDTTETDNNFLIGRSWNSMYRDRYSFQRDTLLEEATRAWRLNPLARRLTNLFKIYNVDGLSFKCEDKPTMKFLEEFWNHELNQMDDQLEEISNEIFLTGNLFPLFSVNTDGMSFIRIYPTDQIEEIITAPNDLRQEQAYTTKATMQAEARTFFNLPTAPEFMRHTTINRLAGTVWGEGEIWPDLPWLGRYASWLEDRVRLNRYRSAFMYIVQGQYTSEAQKKERQRSLNANPPIPGSVLVTDQSEQWGVMAPNLDSFDSSVDGQAIKRMIAVNHVPMHYLAEPESSTRTTADAAGTPTFKSFENHQKTFVKIVTSILKTAAARRAQKDNKVSADAEIKVLAGDATERDNAALALATSQIVQSIGDMYDRKLLDESEYLRLVYRFMGEVRDKNLPTPKGLRKPVDQPANVRAEGLSTDLDTGDVKATKQ